MKSNNRKRLLDICYIGISAAFISVCAYIQIPFFIPITLQSFAILLICGVFGFKVGFLSTLLYILIGIAGLPVFSAGQSGLSALLGPAGGFIIGFLPMSAIVGLACDALRKRKEASFRGRLAVMILAHLILYICGALFYAFAYLEPGGASFVAVLSLTVAPYVFPDIIKSVLAAYLSKRLSFIKTK